MFVIEVRFAEMEKEDQLNDGSQASLLCIKEHNWWVHNIFIPVMAKVYAIYLTTDNQMDCALEIGTSAFDHSIIVSNSN